MHKGRLFPVIDRSATKDAAEAFKGRSDCDACIAKFELSNSMFVIATPFLNDRKSAPDAAVKLKIPEHNDSISEIANVQRCIHWPHQAMLRQN